MEKLGLKIPASFVMKQEKHATNLRCEQCSKTFSRSWLLKNHQRIHTGERPYKCTYCDKAFADKSNLRQHAKIHTTKEKLFQCAICQKTFAQRRYLMKHATEIHRETNSISLVEKAPKVEKSRETKYVVQLPGPPSLMAGVIDSISPQVKEESVQPTVKTKLKDVLQSASENKDKKYSEQDLKDFIKSNQKTMEKNGYIFIKQNFETLDTDAEPTLTELSEIPVQAISDSFKVEDNTGADLEKGNQLLKVNGKMVYLQMENKPATRQEILEATKTKDGLSSVNKGKSVKLDLQGKIANASVSGMGSVKTSRKLVPKNMFVRRHANILKTNSVKKVGLDLNLLNSQSQNQPVLKPVSVPNMVKNVMKSVNPVQLMTMTSPSNSQAEPLTLLQVIPQQQNQQQINIPVSVVQLNPNISQVLLEPIMALNSSPVLSQSQHQPFTSNVQNLKISCVNNLNSDSHTPTNSLPDNVFQAPDIKQEIVEIQHIHAIDEKGAAGELGIGGSSIIANTPIVTDAPWQGVLNINSEQELLDYINSQSSSNVETDQGYTILIQNVDAQNNAVLSAGLDPQSLLSSSGNLSSVFTDQGAMMADCDILPVVTNVEETHEHSSAPGHTEMISPILDSSDDNVHALNGHIDHVVETDHEHVVEIQTVGQGSNTSSGLMGVDNIVHIEIDQKQASIDTDLDDNDQGKLMLIEDHTCDTDDSQELEHGNGELLIREDDGAESDSVAESLQGGYSRSGVHDGQTSGDFVVDGHVLEVACEEMMDE